MTARNRNLFEAKRFQRLCSPESRLSRDILYRSSSKLASTAGAGSKSNREAYGDRCATELSLSRRRGECSFLWIELGAERSFRGVEAQTIVRIVGELSHAQFQSIIPLESIKSPFHIVPGNRNQQLRRFKGRSFV